MAIVLEKEKKPVKLIPLIIVGVVVIVVVGGIYFLFFAPVPGIEAIIPTEQKLTTNLSNLELNTQPAVDAFGSGRLKRYANPPSVGQVGRTNPFVKF